MMYALIIPMSINNQPLPGIGEGPKSTESAISPKDPLELADELIVIKRRGDKYASDQARLQDDRTKRASDSVDLRSRNEIQAQINAQGIEGARKALTEIKAREAQD